MTTDGPVVLLELAHQLHEDWPRVARALRNLADAWQAERAQAAADLVALKRAKEENDERFMIERDAARAEAARYAEALANSDPWTNDVPFNCVYCDAVWDSDIGSSENQHNAGCVWIAAAALRGPAQSEKP